MVVWFRNGDVLQEGIKALDCRPLVESSSRIREKLSRERAVEEETPRQILAGLVVEVGTATSTIGRIILHHR